jgi:hypothetical protein
MKSHRRDLNRLTGALGALTDPHMCLLLYEKHAPHRRDWNRLEQIIPIFGKCYVRRVLSVTMALNPYLVSVT